uniref:non-specific serine/threonine protein kinase n=1 Tax=Gasterosteus aculeatus TaxID=69293 RepID=G3NHW2_GASAC
DSQDSEDPGEYCYGGYHPVQIGDTFNKRYQVLSKLGWGYYSTVWLCLDLRLGRRVAVKVLKSGDGFTQAGQDELALLRCASVPTSRHPSSQRIVQLLDEFKLSGVNGVHMCLVLELLGSDLRSWQLCFGSPGLMQPLVKQILTQVLQGVDYLHTQCKIIHTDVKPENILLCLEEQSYKVPAGDSSSSSVVTRKEANSTGTYSPLKTPFLFLPEKRHLEPCSVNLVGLVKNKKQVKREPEKVKHTHMMLSNSLCWPVKPKATNSALQNEPCQPYGHSYIGIRTQRPQGKSQSSNQSHIYLEQSTLNPKWKQGPYNSHKKHAGKIRYDKIIQHTTHTTSHCLNKKEKHMRENILRQDATASSSFRCIKQLIYIGVHKSDKADVIAGLTIKISNTLSRETHCGLWRVEGPLPNPFAFHALEGGGGGCRRNISRDCTPPPPPSPLRTFPLNINLVETDILDLRFSVCCILLSLLEQYKHFCEEIQTRQYRSLEVLLGSEYGPPADIWSVACMAFELVTGDPLFEPKASKSISMGEDHIAQIIELLGKIPPAILLSGKYSTEYFNRRGDLHRFGPLRLWSLFDVLLEKYHFLLEEATGFSDFLLRMLEYNPERRATAAQCLLHPWLTC